MEASPGETSPSAASPPPSVLAVTQKDWKNTTVATLDNTKSRANQVRFAVRALEQQEAERVVARRVERKRKELLAEAAEKRRKDEIVAERDKRYKEKQAEDLRQQQELLRQGKKVESAELYAATANFKKMKQEAADAKEKERVVTALNNTSQQVLEGVLESQHLLSKLWGALMLCEKRRRLREGRPPTELFKDLVDNALEREWQLLNASRVELNEQATRGEAFRSELGALRVQLNTEQSRAKCLRRVMVKSNSAPGLQSDQQTQVASPKEVLQRAIAVTDEAAELPRHSYSTRLRINSQCDLAVIDVNTSLDRRKDELGELIRGVQAQTADAEKTLGDAERGLVRLRRRIQNTMETPRSSKATNEQLASAESMLVDLRSLKDTLEADLSNKYHSLKIDQGCRQLTKIKSGGHVSKTGQTMRKTASNGSFICKTARDDMQPAG